MRGGDMAYITTQTKNPTTMLWSTAPTKRAVRGASLQKDVARQSKSPKKSKIFTRYIEDPQESTSIFQSKIFSPSNEGRYVAELAWHKERSQSQIMD